MGEWCESRLRDICIGIFDCPHSTPALTKSGPFVVRTQDIRSGTFRADEAAHVSEATYQERIARAEPSPGDILFSREGTYFGVAAEVPHGSRVCLGQRMVLIRPDPSVADARFVRHWLNSPAMAAHIRGRRDGSVAERLNLPTIHDLPIALPPLRLQRRIANILGTLDDKIEINRKLAETLEGAGRALFRSWFVDFDSRQGLGAGDWLSGAVEDLADLNPEIWQSRDRPSVLRYVDLSGTKWGKIGAVTDYQAEDAPSRAQRILRPGDTIVGTVRPGNGSYALVTQDGLTGSTGFAQLRPKRPRDAAFVYLAATARTSIDALAHIADGGAYPAVRPALVAATPVVVPDDQTLQAFSAAASPLLERAALAMYESNTLGAMRDALLPRLLSGDFEVAA